MMMMILMIMMVMDGLQSLARDPGTLSKLTVLPCGGLGVDSDTYWNELHTSRYDDNDNDNDDVFTNNDSR